MVRGALSVLGVLTRPPKVSGGHCQLLFFWFVILNASVNIGFIMGLRSFASLWMTECGLDSQPGFWGVFFN